MKILLIVPAGEIYRITSTQQPVPKRPMLRFSVLPILSVAAATPSEHQVKICDENIEPIDLNADVDVVGISIMTATANRGKEIAQEFRSRGKIAVAGGYHATLYPEDVLSSFDAIVVGDAEEAWTRFLHDIQNGSLQKCYQNARPIDLSRISPPGQGATACSSVSRRLTRTT